MKSYDIILKRYDSILKRYDIILKRYDIILKSYDIILKRYDIILETLRYHTPCRENFTKKIDENSGNFRESLLFSPHISFLRTFLSIILF
jgi:hypothetical protein